MGGEVQGLGKQTGDPDQVPREQEYDPTIENPELQANGQIEPLAVPTQAAYEAGMLLLTKTGAILQGLGLQMGEPLQIPKLQVNADCEV